MKKCPNCSFDNQDDSQFCGNCGAPLSMEAPHGQPQQPQKKEKWYQHTAFTIIMLILFFPVGLVLMWLYRKNWKPAVKAIITAVCVILVLPSVFWDDESSSGRENTDDIWATEPTDIEDFDYYVDDNILFIQEYNGNDDKVYVDSKYEISGKEFSVSALKDGTFLFSDAESVILAEGISFLDNNTFNSCDVKYLYLPSTLEAKEASFWNYFHDVEEIYYGGSNEQWNEICTVPRERLEVKQIYCNVSIDDLGTDKSKSETVKMSSEEKVEDSKPNATEQKEQNPEDKFVSEFAALFSISSRSLICILFEEETLNLYKSFSMVVISETKS